MKLHVILITLLLFSCSSDPDRIGETDIYIKEITTDKNSAVMKQNLLHLYKIYDLTPFLFNKRLEIGNHLKETSAPVIRMSTKYANRPNKLLSRWLHHEFLFYVGTNPPGLDQSLKELKKIFPQAPKLREHSHPYHLLVATFLEYEALTFCVGRKEAKRLVADSLKREKRFPWTYSQVLTRQATLKKILAPKPFYPPILR